MDFNTTLLDYLYTGKLPDVRQIKSTRIRVISLRGIPQTNTIKFIAESSLSITIQQLGEYVDNMNVEDVKLDIRLIEYIMIIIRNIFLATRVTNIDYDEIRRIVFKNIGLFTISFVSPDSSANYTYELNEIHGDSVLKTALIEYLQLRKNITEPAEMTNLIQYYLNKHALIELGNALHIDKFLIAKKAKADVVEDIFEALISSFKKLEDVFTSYYLVTTDKLQEWKLVMIKLSSSFMLHIFDGIEFIENLTKPARTKISEIERAFQSDKTPWKIDVRPNYSPTGASVNISTPVDMITYIYNMLNKFQNVIINKDYLNEALNCRYTFDKNADKHAMIKTASEETVGKLATAGLTENVFINYKNHGYIGTTSTYISIEGLRSSIPDLTYEIFTRTTTTNTNDRVTYINARIKYLKFSHVVTTEYDKSSAEMLESFAKDIYNNMNILKNKKAEDETQ